MALYFTCIEVSKNFFLVYFRYRLVPNEIII
jgi:hypothetical protein